LYTKFLPKTVVVLVKVYSEYPFIAIQVHVTISGTELVLLSFLDMCNMNFTQLALV